MRFCFSLRHRWIVAQLQVLLVSGCCERQELPLSAVVLEDDALTDLARACRISDASSEDEFLVQGITDYLISLNLQPGQNRQDCRVRRDERCKIVEVSCDAVRSQELTNLPSACPRGWLAAPDPPGDYYRLPCRGGCGGAERIPARNIITLDRSSRTSLDRVGQQMNTANRAAALRQVILHVERSGRAQLESPGSKPKPRFRSPDAPCVPMVHYERLQDKASADAGQK